MRLTERKKKKTITKTHYQKISHKFGKQFVSNSLRPAALKPKSLINSYITKKNQFRNIVNEIKRAKSGKILQNRAKTEKKLI